MITYITDTLKKTSSGPFINHYSVGGGCSVGGLSVSAVILLKNPKRLDVAYDEENRHFYLIPNDGGVYKVGYSRGMARVGFGTILNRLGVEPHKRHEIKVSQNGEFYFEY